MLGMALASAYRPVSVCQITKPCTLEPGKLYQVNVSIE